LNGCFRAAVFYNSVDQVIYLLLGAGIYEGVYLIFPEDHPYRRQIGAVLIVACVVGWLAYSRELSIPKIYAPSVVAYFGTASALSISAVALHRWRERTQVRQGAPSLAARLDGFAQICLAKLGSPFSLTHAEREIKERALRDEYVDTFAKEIRQVHRAMTINNEPFADLLDTMIGATPNPAFKLPGLATWVAKTLRLETTLDRRRWIDCRALITFGTYLSLAGVLWFALWIASHK
jgi:hypothetical protein